LHKYSISQSRWYRSLLCIVSSYIFGCSSISANLALHTDTHRVYEGIVLRVYLLYILYLMYIVHTCTRKQKPFVDCRKLCIPNLIIFNVICRPSYPNKLKSEKCLINNSTRRINYILIYHPIAPNIRKVRRIERKIEGKRETVTEVNKKLMRQINY
jgi:hypothetical protein